MNPQALQALRRVHLSILSTPRPRLPVRNAGKSRQTSGRGFDDLKGGGDQSPSRGVQGTNRSIGAAQGKEGHGYRLSGGWLLQGSRRRAPIASLRRRGR